MFFDGSQINPVITNSNIISSGSDGIYSNSNSWTVFTLENSCVTTQKSSEYALLLNIDGTNSKINSNCFYATEVDFLAKAAEEGNDFSGNYWDGNSGDYDNNNVLDESTLTSCPNSCGSTLPSPVIDYRFDECSWHGTTDEVKDSSDNDLHGTTISTVEIFSDEYINNSTFAHKFQ